MDRLFVSPVQLAAIERIYRYVILSPRLNFALKLRLNVMLKSTFAFGFELVR